jgi:hypothetical protein
MISLSFERMSSNEDCWKAVRFFAVLGGVIALSVGLYLASISRAQADTMLPHPAGCPRVAFCGCGASADLYGRPVRALWLAASWFKFPRAQPARNMAAVRRHHIFVLKQHVRGNVWLVADYNSGGHKSRLHQRSIAGYAIVDPFAHSRMAMVR